jgi:hypothetical protein
MLLSLRIAVQQQLKKKEWQNQYKLIHKLLLPQIVNNCRRSSINFILC